jgi:peptidoglycan L-alanyl-D-glutamate endopeptidase CwlK
MNLTKNQKWIVAGMLSITALTLIFIRRRINKLGKKIEKDIVEYTQNKVWDLSSESKIETLHPKIRDKARELINKAEKELGIKLRVTSGFRTWKEQDELYAKGRTKSGSIVTNAKGGQSNHNYGTAFDVVPIVNGKADWKSNRWDEIGKLGKEVGFSWGGDWKSIVDKPHFEMTFGNSLAQLRKKYLEGDKDGEYVRLG